RGPGPRRPPDERGSPPPPLARGRRGGADAGGRPPVGDRRPALAPPGRPRHPAPLRGPRTITTLAAPNLKRTYGGGDGRVVALDDVSLELRGGEFSLLMGPSGSGKSTLLAALSGLVPPDSGSVVALGQEVWGMSEDEREEFRRRSTGFIFQGYNLFP